MDLVRNHLIHIKSMFPDIEEAFLNANLDIAVDDFMDIILADDKHFVKRRKRTHEEENDAQNNADKTLCFSDSTSQNDLSHSEVFLDEIDVEHPAVHSFFVSLADHKLFQASRKERPALDPEEVHELLSYFVGIFTKVRRPLFHLALRKNISIDELLLVSFFIENKGTEDASFETIIERMSADKLTMRRQSLLSQTTSFSSRLDFKPLIKCRTFNGTYQIKQDTLRQLVAGAVANFENVLIELLQNSENTEPMKGIRWMDKPIMQYFSKKLQKGTTTFECSVCFTEFVVSKSFRCTAIDGSIDNGQNNHLFCLECVRGQAEASANEALLSEGALGLRCMASDCRNAILFSKIRPYLSRALRHRLEQRITNQTLCSAGLSGLEYCLQCDFAMIMEVPKKVDKVFNCRKCGYAFCRLCEEDWTKHFGLSCEKVKENSEDAKRREVEKKLNEAVVRCCPKCRLQFVKLDACNKMTCACGTTQCYICREVGITYEHFCNHLRDPKNPKAKCTHCAVPKCLLWEDFKRRDREAMDRILKESNVNVNIPNSPMPGPSTATQQQPQVIPAVPLHIPVHLPRPERFVLPPPQRFVVRR